MNIFNVNPAIMWHDDLFLRKPSRYLKPNEVLSDKFKETVNFMFQSLYENPIGVGLAAPQIGLMIRLVVIDIKRDGKKPLVLINPEFTPVENTMVQSNESCLSFTKRFGVVNRYKKIRVKAQNVKFETFEFEADSFLSLVCQHEIDHLDGKIYIDKVDNVLPYPDPKLVLANKVTDFLYSE